MRFNGEEDEAAQGRDAPLDSTVPTEKPRTPGGVELTRYDPEFETGMDASRDFMRRYPNVLRKLAEG